MQGPAILNNTRDSIPSPPLIFVRRWFFPPLPEWEPPPAQRLKERKLFMLLRLFDASHWWGERRPGASLRLGTSLDGFQAGGPVPEKLPSQCFIPLPQGAVIRVPP